MISVAVSRDRIKTQGASAAAFPRSGGARVNLWHVRNPDAMNMHMELYVDALSGWTGNNNSLHPAG